MNKVIAIVGMCGSGKSVACEHFENLGFQKVYFGGVTMDKLKEENLEVTPENEKMMRNRLRQEYGMGAFAYLLQPKIESYLEKGNVVLDGLYSWEEYLILREKFKNQISLLAIIDNKQIRYERLEKRDIRPLTNSEAQSRDISEIEQCAKGGPIAFADYYILNNGSLDEYKEDLEKFTTCIMEEVL